MKYITFTIPCYNSQDYMRHCIDNLVAAGEDVEVIIVNDGSKDDTGKIADEYEKKYPTIVKAIQKENGGHGSGVMAGIRNATGMFFKVVDSDDWIETKDVLDMLDLIKRHEAQEANVDLYITNYVYEHAADNSQYVMHYRKCLPPEQIFAWEDMKRVKLETVFLMHSLLYRTSKLRESKMDLPNHTFYVDDIYAYQPLPFMKKIFYHDIDLYHYFIGRADQSVNYGTMCKRYEQQMRVFKIMFTAYTYDEIIKRAIFSVRPDNIATFLGKKITYNCRKEVGTNYNQRFLGTRIKHHMGDVSIKMYDKHGLVLRIESTCNNVGEFRVKRKVEHRDGTISEKKASMKKSIYSLYQLFTIMKAANYRYLEYVSSFDDHSNGDKHLTKVSKPVHEKKRSYRGMNFFDERDLKVLETIGRGEFMTYGMQNKDIRKYIDDISSSAMSRIFKRLRLHGLIEKAAGSYKYFPTALGKEIISAGLTIRSMVLIPALSNI